jgi:hypothetical protein
MFSMLLPEPGAIYVMDRDTSISRDFTYYIRPVPFL